MNFEKSDISEVLDVLTSHIGISNADWCNSSRFRMHDRFNVLSQASTLGSEHISRGLCDDHPLNTTLVFSPPPLCSCPITSSSFYCVSPCYSFFFSLDFLTLLGAFAKLRKAAISFVMSVHLSSWNSASTGRIFMKCDTSVFFENLSIQLQYN